MMDPIFWRGTRCSYNVGPLLCDFCYPTPLAEDILKKEVMSVSCFLLKWAPSSHDEQRTMCLDKVPKLVYCQHEHIVYVDLAEKRRMSGIVAASEGDESAESDRMHIEMNT